MNKALWCGRWGAGLVEAKGTTTLNRTSLDWDYVAVSILALGNHLGRDSVGGGGTDTISFQCLLILDRLHRAILQGLRPCGPSRRASLADLGLCSALWRQWV